MKSLNFRTKYTEPLLLVLIVFVVLIVNLTFPGEPEKQASNEDKTQIHTLQYLIICGIDSEKQMKVSQKTLICS